MNDTHRVLRVVAAALTLSAIPLLASSADVRPPYTQQAEQLESTWTQRGGGPSTPAQPPRAERVSVNEVFTRDLENGCQYRATVTGSIVPEGGSTATAAPQDEQRHAADLRVQAMTTCRDSAAPRRVTARIRDSGLSRSDIERRIELAGRVAIWHGGRVCTYQPSFTWQGRDVFGDSVNVGCEVARGGGPRHTPDRPRTVPDRPRTGSSDTRP